MDIYLYDRPGHFRHLRRPGPVRRNLYGGCEERCPQCARIPLTMLCVAGCFLSLDAEFRAWPRSWSYAGGIVGALPLPWSLLVELSKYRRRGVFQLQTRSR